MNLTAKKPVHINGGWVQPGQPVPYGVAGFNYEVADQRGLIESDDGEPITNPEVEAAGDQAGATAASLAQDVARLKGELDAARAGADTLKRTQDELATLKAKYAGIDLTGLQQGNRSSKAALKKAQDELALAQSKAATPEDQAALAEYRDVVGALLPSDFPARKILLENGYYTVDTIAGALDDDLRDLDGIADGKLAEIRKITPYNGEG